MKGNNEPAASVTIRVHRNGEMVCRVEGKSHDVVEALIYTLALSMHKAQRPEADPKGMATKAALDILEAFDRIGQAEQAETAQRARTGALAAGKGANA